MKKRITFALAACILLLAACDKDSNSPNPDSTRTPLLPAGIKITALATRADQTAADFFEEGDELALSIFNKDDHMYITGTAYIYNKGNDQWTFAPDADVIYYEDRDPGKEDYLLSFGTSPMNDQTTPANLHQADMISGKGTLDPATRTLTAITLERQSTRLTINITPGAKWTGNDFASYITDIVVHITGGDIITPMKSATGSYTCILHPVYLPDNGGTLFTLTTSSGREIPCTYTLPTGVNDKFELFSKTLTINATLDATGHLNTGTTTLAGWTEVPAGNLDVEDPTN